MKFRFNKKYTQIAVYAVIVIVLSGFLLMSASVIPNLSQMFDTFVAAAAPVIWGIVIAYLLNPGVDFFRFKVFKKWSEKAKTQKTENVIKNISIAIVVILALGLIAGLGALIIPQLYQSVSGLVNNFDDYSKNFLNWANETFRDIPQISEILANPIAQIETFLETSWSDISTYLLDFGSKVGGSVLNFILGFKDFIIGFIIAVYFLSSKKMLKAQAKKILFALIKNSHAQTVISVSCRCNDIFSHYISGILIDAFFVGSLTFIGATVIGTPYPILIAVIIACTNVIPFFGPFLGGIPACFLTLLADPIKALWLAIFFVVLQQFDGNIMVPLIQGDRIGVPSVWVLVGLIIGGGLFGFAGMLLSVPVFAILYMLFKEFLATRLRKKNLPVESNVYGNIDVTKYVDGYVYTEEEKAADDEFIKNFTAEKPKAKIRIKRKSKENKE